MNSKNITVEGIAKQDTTYCPFCGSSNLTHKGNGSSNCDNCEKYFFVIDDTL